MPSPPVPSRPGDQSPLSAEDHRVLALARKQRRSLRNAEGMASFNGWSLLVCGLLCLFMSGGEPAIIVMGLVLLVMGAVELYGRTLLRALDPLASKVLTFNQVALMLLILIYCGVSGYRGAHAVDPMGEAMATYGEFAELAELMQLSQAQGMAVGDDWANETYREVVVTLYSVVAIIGVLFQGGCAYYYFRRRPLLESMRAIPDWVHQILDPDWLPPRR